jgi:hypothetical protein
MSDLDLESYLRVRKLLGSGSRYIYPRLGVCGDKENDCRLQRKVFDFRA